MANFHLCCINFLYILQGNSFKYLVFLSNFKAQLNLNAIYTKQPKCLYNTTVVPWCFSFFFVWYKSLKVKTINTFDACTVAAAASGEKYIVMYVYANSHNTQKHYWILFALPSHHALRWVLHFLRLFCSAQLSSAFMLHVC